MAQSETMDVRGLMVVLIQTLVDTPEDVVVTVTDGHHATVIEVDVAPGEFGKVLGRKGRTTDSIREYLFALGGKYRRKFVLELIEPRRAP